jgi:uncharacterized membrane protein
MNPLKLAIVLAVIGVLLCLWLLAGVNWYNFMAFMLIAQPLLLLAVLIFAVVVVREMRRKGVA